jgi:hypothetical protein
MKGKILLIVLFSVSYISSMSQEIAIQKKNPAGNWKFEAPAAPEGYTAGTMIVSVAENKYSAGVIFSNFEYKFQGEKVKYAVDSLTYVINLEGEAVKVLLKIEDPAKMSGKAVYSKGTVLLLLTKLP